MKSPSRDWRPHVELAIHWSLANVQRVMSLVDTGVKCSLVMTSLSSFLVLVHALMAIVAR